MFSKQCIRSFYRIAGVLVCANLLDEHPTAIKQVLKKLDCRRHAYTASLSERLMAWVLLTLKSIAINAEIEIDVLLTIVALIRQYCYNRKTLFAAMPYKTLWSKIGARAIKLLLLP